VSFFALSACNYGEKPGRKFTNLSLLEIYWNLSTRWSFVWNLTTVTGACKKTCMYFRAWKQSWYRAGNSPTRILPTQVNDRRQLWRRSVVATGFNNQEFWNSPKECICAVYMVVRMKRDNFFKYYEQICLYNGEVLHFISGRDWTLEWASVFKGLQMLMLVFWRKTQQTVSTDYLRFL
jgi:hypothetical protein